MKKSTVRRRAPDLARTREGAGEVLAALEVKVAVMA
jgi:hypothetical protein